VRGAAEINYIFDFYTGGSYGMGSGSGFGPGTVRYIRIWVMGIGEMLDGWVLCCCALVLNRYCVVCFWELSNEPTCLGGGILH
jgi:hypothetical protein